MLPDADPAETVKTRVDMVVVAPGRGMIPQEDAMVAAAHAMGRAVNHNRPIDVAMHVRTVHNDRSCVGIVWPADYDAALDRTTPDVDIGHHGLRRGSGGNGGGQRHEQDSCTHDCLTSFGTLVRQARDVPFA